MLMGVNLRCTQGSRRFSRSKHRTFGGLIDLLEGLSSPRFGLADFFRVWPVAVAGLGLGTRRGELGDCSLDLYISRARADA